MLLSTLIAKKLRESRIVAILLMFIGLFWGFLFSFTAIKYMGLNQQEAVYRAQTLVEGENRVIEIETYLVDPVNQGKLVHLSGNVSVNEMLKETLFEITAVNVLALQRVVKMYQWTEKVSKKQDGTLDYTYDKIWLEQLIDSSLFELSQAHRNPSSMLITGQVSFAKPVKLGEFILPHNLIEKMSQFQWLPMTVFSFLQVPENLASLLGEQKIQLYDGHYYIGDDPNSPQIGDLQIRFEIMQPEKISIVAQQINSSLMPYQTQTAVGEIELFELGTVSAEQMFYNAKKQNFFAILSESFGIFLIMGLGFYIIFIALWLSKNALPILGNPANLKGWLISVVLAAVVTLIIIALNWIDYSPLIGRTLLVIAVCLLYFFKFARKSPQPTLIHEEIVPQKQNSF